MAWMGVEWCTVCEMRRARAMRGVGKRKNGLWRIGRVDACVSVVAYTNDDGG